jgi:protein TonB
MRIIKAKNNRFFSMLWLAIIIHLVLVLAINFEVPRVNRKDRLLKITVVNNTAKKAPKKAEFFAQNNQTGAGKKKVKKKVKPTPVRLKPKRESKQVSKPTAPQKKTVQNKALTQKKSSYKTKESKKTIPKLSAASLYKQVAELGEQIRYQQVSRQKNNRIKFVNAVSAHKYLAAQYISDWQRKVESMGNLNYPNIAQRAGFSQSLTMDVGIKADGSIYTLQIRKSSGYPALDEAAKRIVRLSEPFPALPKALLKELDILVITRVWKFTDKIDR